jgi:hypothetical protein
VELLRVEFAECYVTVRILGVAQSFTALGLTIVIGLCARWLVQMARELRRPP